MAPVKIYVFPKIFCSVCFCFLAVLGLSCSTWGSSLPTQDWTQALLSEKHLLS